MSIENVRARLRDRQVKDGALGTDEVTVCLDVQLVEELERLKADLALEEKTITASTPDKGGKPRLGSTPAEPEPDPIVEELKAQIAEAEAGIQESSLRLVFRAIGSAHYQELLNAHPGANDTEDGQASFLQDLAGACLHRVYEWETGEEKRVEGLAWDEIRPELSYGEWDLIAMKVLALNRRKVDVPLSLRRSGKTRR